MSARAEGAGQRVDDVGQAAGLGEGLTFGGEHRDAHRGDGTRTGTGTQTA